MGLVGQFGEDTARYGSLNAVVTLDMWNPIVRFAGHIRLFSIRYWQALLWAGSPDCDATNLQMGWALVRTETRSEVWRWRTIRSCVYVMNTKGCAIFSNRKFPFSLIATCNR